MPSLLCESVGVQTGESLDDNVLPRHKHAPTNHNIMNTYQTSPPQQYSFQLHLDHWMLRYLTPRETPEVLGVARLEPVGQAYLSSKESKHIEITGFLNCNTTIYKK